MNDWEAGTSCGAVTGDFDVFLNHRGPDVKAKFVSHLEDALRCSGFRPFVDARALIKGNPALASIDEALAMAKVHVAVVSPGYAQSKYCLDELVAMVRSGKPVVPVFYGVEPVDLRWVEKGPFAAAFEGHKVKRTETRVGEWREALGKLAGITGFRLVDYASNEAMLKREVVKRVACLTPSNELVEVDECRVGLEGRTDKCVEMLENMGAKVGILGLVGMGGVGKTTLAREIYNRFAAMNTFPHMTFLEMHKVNMSSSNVEVRPNKSKWLRKQLLWDLLRVESDSSSYKSWLGKVSRLGPVFIVMDDVHKLDQFQDVIPSVSLLHLGSRILITSRDRSTIECVPGITKIDLQLYDVGQLDWKESKILFNWHAFHNHEAPDDFKSVAMDIVKACGGLPLALKVIGSSLHAKKSTLERQTIWLEAVDTLRERKDVMGVLRWSYDFLSDVEKRMFLDITCMFYNGSVEDALAYWRSCASCGVIKTLHTSLMNLVDKNLIKKDCWGRLEVHDILLDMGLEMGRRANTHLVCNDMEDGLALARKGVEETVVLNLAKSRKRKFDATIFSNMPNLHHLILPTKCRVNGDLRCISKKLRLLQWREVPLRCISTKLNLIHLLDLDFGYSTNLGSTWTEANGFFEDCPNLRRLNLEHCSSITKLPDSIGQLKALENLKIDGCTNLKAIPDSLGLSNLRSLRAWGCNSLLKLPSSIGQSSQLEELNLPYCKSLEKLPKSIGQLHALKSLDVRGCTSLKALPKTIGALSNLVRLEAIHCTSLVKVPYSSIGLLRSLIILAIEPGTKCQDFIRGSIGGAWTQLRSLHLSTCVGLGFGVDYAAMKSLHIVQLKDRTLTQLPEALGLLVHLLQLTINSCESLQNLEFPQSFRDLKKLFILEWINCKNLRKLPNDWQVVTHLERLFISRCPIKTLPKSISCLSELKELDLIDCENMQKLPTSIRQLKNLKDLKILGCGSIEAMGALTTLQGLPIWGSTSLTHLPASLHTISCLIIASKYWYKFDDYYIMSGGILEEDESGYLAIYRHKVGGIPFLVRRRLKKRTIPTDIATSLGSNGAANN